MKVEVKISGKTKTVEFEEFANSRCQSTEQLGAFQKGGGKIWFKKLTYYSDVKRLIKNEVFLNRNGYRLIGFAEDFQSNESEHNSAE